MEYFGGCIARVEKQTLRILCVSVGIRENRERERDIDKANGPEGNVNFFIKYLSHRYLRKLTDAKKTN